MFTAAKFRSQVAKQIKLAAAQQAAKHAPAAKTKTTIKTSLPSSEIAALKEELAAIRMSVDALTKALRPAAATPTTKVSSALPTPAAQKKSSPAVVQKTTVPTDTSTNDVIAASDLKKLAGLGL